MLSEREKSSRGNATMTRRHQRLAVDSADTEAEVFKLQASVSAEPFLWFWVYREGGFLDLSDNIVAMQKLNKISAYLCTPNFNVHFLFY